jgi:hypothetical protein
MHMSAREKGLGGKFCDALGSLKKSCGGRL